MTQAVLAAPARSGAGRKFFEFVQKNTMPSN